MISRSSSISGMMSVTVPRTSAWVFRSLPNWSSNLKGQIVVDIIVGQGSCFSVALPGIVDQVSHPEPKETNLWTNLRLITLG